MNHSQVKSRFAKVFLLIWLLAGLTFSPVNAATLIPPGKYKCEMADPYSATLVTIKGNSYVQTYEDGTPIGKGTFRRAKDVKAQMGGTTVWFKGGGLGGFPGEFVRKGTVNPGDGTKLMTNQIRISARPGGFFVVICQPK